MSSPDPPPHSQNLRLHRRMEGPGTFFVTKCLEPRKPVIDDQVASTVGSALFFYVEKKLIYLAAFVVMLDHWHALIATGDGKPISHRMQDLGRWLAERVARFFWGRVVFGRMAFMKPGSVRPNNFSLFVPISRRILSVRD